MKRILSIILSVLLIVGCVAISVVTNAQVGDKFVFEAETCFDSANTISATQISKGQYLGWNADCSATAEKQDFLMHDRNVAKVDDYVTFNLTGLEAGSYEVYFASRQATSRSVYKVEVWDATNTVQTIDEAVNFASKTGTNITSYSSSFVTIKTTNDVTVTTGDSLTMKMTITTAVTNGFYLDKILLVKTADTDGEEVSTVPTEPEEPSEETTTTTTTTTVPVDTEGTYTIEDVANPDSWTVGQYKTDGTFNPASTGRASVKKLIEVVAGTTYVIDAENNTERTFKYVIREFDADRKVIQSISGFTFGGKYTPSENVACIALIMYDNSPYADIVAGNIKPSMTVYVEETTTTTTTEVEVPTMPEGYFTIEDVANPDNWTEGQYKENGAFDPNNTDRACLKKLVKVVPGTTYSLYAKCDDKKSFVIREYDADKNFVNSYGIVTAGFTYAPSSDEVAYIGVSLYPGAPYADIVAGNILPAMKVQELMTDLVEMQPGVSIRLNEVNGMRFYATLNCDANEVDEMGIIIAPVDIIGNRFTTEDDHIKIPYVYKDQLWENNTFVASIVNVADRNLARDFIARAYVVIDGVTYYSKNTTTRNLAGVADAFVADEKGGYAELDADTQALVETWAKAND